ncbi:MAG: Protein oar [Calditrichaeota bacterium]|nr:Protein oar [Calditrichota bacterium]
MRGVRAYPAPLAVLMAFLLLPGLVLAQTGKIRGTVVDSETGDPVIGANVVVENTSRGAATDLDGRFFIVAMTPGTYTVRASAVGYTPVTIEQVEVNIDRTTELEFELAPSALELEPVTVVFEKPVVEPDVTSNVTRYNKEDIEFLPDTEVTSVLTQTPGFKVDEEGKIHIRGGRETEARFLVDGIDTRDPITGESLPLNLSAINIQEIQILTGGMAAEYGQAQSGFVTITTPEGAPDQYNGTVYWESDSPFGEYSFDEDQVDAALGGPVPFTTDLLDRPITFYLTFNGQISNTHTYLGGEYPNQDYVGLGVDLPRRQYNDIGGSLKLAYDIGNGQKLSAYFAERTLDWDVYGRSTAEVGGNYGWQYKYNVQNLPRARDKRSSFRIDYTNQASDKTVLNFSVGRQVINASLEPRGKEPGEFALEDEIEEFRGSGVGLGFDLNENGRWDQDADGDGVIHSSIDELSQDLDVNNFLDGYVDANRSGHWEGENEGYEDLNQNGQWDRGEDWIDLNGNGVYDYAEPWTDVVDPVTGQNNVGVYDPWDTFIDLNGNGVWDPAEPQLPEQDLNNNGLWDGERFQDANGNGVFDRWEPFEDLNGDGQWTWNDSNRNGIVDPGEAEPFTDLNGNGYQDDGEGYDDMNLNGEMDRRDLVSNTNLNEETAEPFWDGDIWYDTGEPFIDLPDPVTGLYNGVWDDGEPFWDLPSSNSQVTRQFNIPGQESTFGVPTLNGQYDPPDGEFDEYELFTFQTGNPRQPVGYTYNLNMNGTDWPSDYLAYDPNHSTWINRTIHDEDAPRFNPPNNIYDRGEERYVDFNGNGQWNGPDLFLNPGRWDNSVVWSKRRTEEYSFEFSWQSQVHKFHEVKVGTEMKYYIMSQQQIQTPDQPYTGEASLDEDAPFTFINEDGERVGYGAVRDFWEYRPWEGAFYVQDKMEFEGLIVQAGVRSDFIIHDQEVIDEQRRRLEAGEPGATDARRSRFAFAPRLGISHPITNRSKLYFNYGHFFKLPPFLNFYKSTTTNVDQGVVGNPNLKFERSVTYELGVHTQVTDNLSFQIAGYYRDLYDQISTIEQRDGPIVITRYINLDYGRARGFELKVDRKFANHFQATFNYDFSFAYGKSSGALDEFENRSSNVPVNYDEHPLNWDQTHQMNFNTAVMYAKGDHPELFGLRFPDYWLLSVQWQFGSGRPYTPSEYTTGLDPNLILENSERYPWWERTNLRFEKYFDMGGVKWIAGLQVYNLWDKKNVNSLYTETGSPDIAVHPYNPDYNPGLNRADYDSNPRNYSAGRQILLKFGLEF